MRMLFQLVAGLFLSFIFITGSLTQAQDVGDYTSAASGSWSTLTTWTRWNGSSWATPTSGEGYPGQFAVPGLVQVQSGHTIALDVSPANNIGSIGLNGTLTIGNSTTNRTLSVAEDIIINSGAVFQTAGDGGNVLNIGGNLENDGTFDANIGAATMTTVFNGGGSKSILGLGITDFNALTVSNGTTLNLDKSITLAGTLTISATNSLIVHAGIVLERTATGTLSIGGTITFNSGSTYRHSHLGGTVPTATWNSNSNCEIILTSPASGTGSWPAGTGQSFGNFSITTTGTGTAGYEIAGSVSCAGNFTLNNGSSRPCILANSSTARAITVGGNFTISAGTLNLSSSSGNGTINVAGNFSNSGILNESGTSTGSAIVFNGSGVQTFTAGTTTNTINYTINSGATVNLNSGLVVNTGAALTVNGRLNMGSNLITGAGSFVLNSTGILGIGHANGISASDASGNIQVTGNRTYNAAAHFVYNGSVPQVFGDGLPLTITGQLEIDNTSGVTWESPLNNPYPVIAATNTSAKIGQMGTTHTINLPAGIQSGDLLLIFWTDETTSSTAPTTPSGFTQLYTQTTSNEVRRAWYKIANGTESATINVTGGDERSAHISYRIAKNTYIGTPEVGTVATGTSNAPNPPSLSPTWPLAHTLWIAASHSEGNTAAMTGPSGYTGLIQSNTGSTGSSNSTTATAHLFSQSSSQDPGTFSLSTSRPWAANTIAIRGNGNEDPIPLTMFFNSALTFTNGKLFTGINTIDLGTSGTISGEANGRYLVGNLTATRNIGTSSESFGGIGVTLFPTDVCDTCTAWFSFGNSTVTRKSGPGSQVVSNYGDTSIYRQWTIDVENQPFIAPPSAKPFFRNVRFDWVTDDNNGNNNITNYIGLRSSDGNSPWYETGALSYGSASTTLRVNQFSTFSIINKDEEWFFYGFDGGTPAEYTTQGQSTSFLPANTKTYGGTNLVSIGVEDEGFWKLENLENIELTEPWGTGLSLTGAAATNSSSVNKFSIINFSGTPFLTLRFDVLFEGGAGEWYLFIGDSGISYSGTSFPSIGNDDFFIALKWVLSAGEEITLSYLNNSNNWVVIGNAFFAKGNSYTVDIFANNSEKLEYYYYPTPPFPNPQEVDQRHWALWVNGIQLSPVEGPAGFDKAFNINRNSLNSLSFIGINSPDNDAIIHIDNINFGNYFDDSNPPLPVELSSFTAKIVGSAVQLNWRTETEIMNYGFDVERKGINQSDWKKIGFVQGHGNSNSPKEYSYKDKDVEAGKYLYRLKQIDTDGSFAYSPVIEVDLGIPREFKLSQNYPNPFNPSTKITFSLPVATKVSLTIYNILGEKVLEAIADQVYEAGVYEYNFDGSKLSSGIYLYSIQTDKFVQTKKMLMVK
jgi:hypothetical protein